MEVVFFCFSNKTKLVPDRAPAETPRGRSLTLLLMPCIRPTTEQAIKKIDAPHGPSVRRVLYNLRPTEFAAAFALPVCVVTVHPVAMMVTPPSPMARVPIPARAVIVIPRPVVVISAIADFDIEPDRLCRHRSKRSRAKERGQQNSKFVFHSSLSLVRISTNSGRILFENSDLKQARRDTKPRPAQRLPVPPTCHARELSPANARPRQPREC
jgi:hypothetical protein